MRYFSKCPLCAAEVRRASALEDTPAGSMHSLDFICSGCGQALRRHHARLWVTIVCSVGWLALISFVFNNDAGRATGWKMAAFGILYTTHLIAGRILGYEVDSRHAPSRR